MTAWVKTYPAARADQGRREARVLRMAAHPGVAQLLDIAESTDGSVALSFARLPGPDLLSAVPATPARAVSLAAGLAAVVADLHAVGVAHGALEARHVLLDCDGAPVLCGFGNATPDADSRARRADVDGLIRLVGVLLLERAAWPSARRVHRAVRRCRSADTVARRLAGLSAQLPSSETPRPARSPSPGWRRRTVWIAGATLTIAGMAWLAFGRSSLPAPAPCPATDAGCRPLASSDGVIEVAAGRFQAGEPGDVVVLGRWGCGSEGLPAVLRPSTGEVWVFDRWPSGDLGVPARLVGRVPDARSLRVIPNRCDRIEVFRAGSRAPVILVPLAGAS